MDTILAKAGGNTLIILGAIDGGRFVVSSAVRIDGEIMSYSADIFYSYTSAVHHFNQLN
jgi:hypothetical protein